MTPYKILTLWGIHKEFNPDKFKVTTQTPNYTDEGDIDSVMNALGG